MKATSVYIPQSPPPEGTELPQRTTTPPGPSAALIPSNPSKTLSAAQRRHLLQFDARSRMTNDKSKRSRMI